MLTDARHASVSLNSSEAAPRLVYGDVPVY